MESKYTPLDPKWQDDEAIKCCKDQPSDGGGGCDCCYDNWVSELKVVKQKYGTVSEKAKQINEDYIFTASQRDKIKVWLDDLVKAEQLAMSVCDYFSVMSAQTEKICINTDKATEAIRILFCMIRDFFEKTDEIVDAWTYIDNCIKCLNSEELPEGSGIRKCLKNYRDKIDALQKLVKDLIKSIMTAVATANGLHAGICSDYGLVYVIKEWRNILGCNEKCGTPTPSDPCLTPADKVDPNNPCRLLPVLHLPLCNDPHYAWVRAQYDIDVNKTKELGEQLVTINKEKESLSACQTSLETAIKEVNPKDLCK
jgi:hypothetical protein